MTEERKFQINQEAASGRVQKKKVLVLLMLQEMLKYAGMELIILMMAQLIALI